MPMFLKRKRTRVVLLLLLACFAAIQFIRPAIPNPPVTADINVPADVHQVLKAACYDCHSNETQLKWFDQVAPAYWLVADHVKQGRMALNFSQWDSLAPAAQKANLYLSVNQVLFGAMPLSQYTALHPGAKLTDKEISILKNYVGSLSPLTASDTAAFHAAAKQYEQWINSKVVREDTNHGVRDTNHGVQPALNGIGYINGYNNWKAISTTDRFDNGTMRVIFGNEVAAKAIEEGHINPWPDGTVFAKVAWEQLVDTAGMVHAGRFKQVEFMIKDSKKYASTKGWGWARWLGTQLTPYGKTAGFATECVNCHNPLKNTDYVFTIPRPLKADTLAFNPLEWKVITTIMNKKNNTMSTLYGNDAAAAHAARGHAGNYPADAKLALVNWSQVADAHWFGANTPGKIRSVESISFEQAPAKTSAPIYQLYEGSPLRLSKTTDEQAVTGREKLILGLTASVIP